MEKEEEDNGERIESEIRKEEKGLWDTYILMDIENFSINNMSTKTIFDKIIRKGLIITKKQKKGISKFLKR